ncbi:Sugar phosphate permease [Streptoalloteichus tenebrarius]|uniref:Sugar phosphate permease n=1 Tax=Streptoalloteichus tenebrarius (strain ATCC 17920 / DSM 40477 / JCM 4838 / CBS 697.72 / NBRC 16177 / NCIMB 11028 / NRRL B-12390 / A12253. 1 / ISP 5477) TaxID=1933 RepID=A0ABT1HQC7_STRSD|nr:MFS transporter [Streptoalloteichus tenebrarius]MCP2257715.1 Sugar phosphate permease [Streptoalloteichus tenebrarius]BFE99931.1 MFS transporter [Streptoalloteichus tenebrarius]
MSIAEASATSSRPEVVGTGPGHQDTGRAWLVWGAGVACYVAALFHRMSLGVAAQEALDRFATGPAVLALFTALQLGVYLVLQVPAGVLADRWGPRRVLTGGTMAMAVGAVLFAVSTALPAGIAARVLVGAGDAFMFTNVLRLAAHWFTPRRYGLVVSLTGLAGGAGQLVATVPLTTSLHNLGWTGTFLAAGAATVVLAVAALALVRDRAAAPEPVHAAAAAPVERVRTALRGVVAQRGTRHAFWSHFVFMGQFVALTALWGAPWLTTGQGHSAAEAATLLMVCVLAFTLSSPVIGRVAAGNPARTRLFSEVLAVVVLVGWLTVVLWPGALPLPVVVTVLVVLGVGGASALLAFDTARSANPEHRSGTAAGVVNLGGFTCAVLAQLAVGWVLQAAGPTGYRWAFVPVVVLVAVGAVGLFRNRLTTT